MSEYGQVVWPSPENPIWKLDYRLVDSPDAEGIVVANAYYRGQEVFYKASLPSLRVQYDNNYTGPYKDPLYYGNAQFQNGTTKKVRVYTYSSFGLQALVLETSYQIGWYKLIQRWTFWQNGQISPRLYSSGIIEHKNHSHHVYWRFDFDINGAGNNLALEYNTYDGNHGWGKGWHIKAHEITRTKYPAANRTWAILNKSTTRGYMISPGDHDGTADSFSTSDFWVTHYHASEDKHGNQGSAYSDDLQPYLNGENTDGQDVVLWYCAHLRHVADGETGDEWHHAGPELIPFRY